MFFSQTENIFFKVKNTYNPTIVDSALCDHVAFLYSDLFRFVQPKRKHELKDTIQQLWPVGVGFSDFHNA